MIDSGPIDKHFATTHYLSFATSGCSDGAVTRRHWGSRYANHDGCRGYLRSRGAIMDDQASIDTRGAEVPPEPARADPVAGELITETLDYDGGRQVTVYAPPGA